MIIRIHVETPVDPQRFDRLFDFLAAHRFAPEGADIVLEGAWADRVSITHKKFTRRDTADPSAIGLEAAFLGPRKVQNYALIKGIGEPKLLVGSRGLPQSLKRVCIPFEGRRFRAAWLRSLIEVAARMGFKARLIHCDHGIVAKEILALADWFRLGSVKDALNEWLNEETRRAFGDLIEDYPDLEIKTRFGRLRTLLHDEDPMETMILGSIGHANLLRRRYHGVHWGTLLTQTGICGYFLPEWTPAGGMAKNRVLL